jgi:hypothetical protein
MLPHKGASGGDFNPRQLEGCILSFIIIIKRLIALISPNHSLEVMPPGKMQ